MRRNVLIIIVVAIIASLIWAGYQAGWTGFSGKKLWDWMQLFIIPGVLGFGALFFNAASQRAERRRTLEQNRQDILATFIDKMADLILVHKLEDPEKGWGGVGIARARSLHALRNLDGERKGHLIRFLYDSGVISIPLRDGSFESHIYLSYADLSGANLENVHLEGVGLWHANLEMANLMNARLIGTFLKEANMTGANLEMANMSGANLDKAIVTPEQIESAWALEGAIMPDGTKYEEWIDKGKPDWTKKQS